MTDFVDLQDRRAVEVVLRGALTGVGVDGLLAALAHIPGLQMHTGRARSLLRAAEPAGVTQGDQRVDIWPDGHAAARHIVGNVVLSTDHIVGPALPGVLSDLLLRAVQLYDCADSASVVLTSLRDALAAGRTDV